MRCSFNSILDIQEVKTPTAVSKKTEVPFNSILDIPELTDQLMRSISEKVGFQFYFRYS